MHKYKMMYEEEFKPLPPEDKAAVIFIALICGYIATCLFLWLVSIVEMIV